MKDIIGKGAEAEITVVDDRIRKERVSKGYRHEKIDKKLRKERTDKEARLLEKSGRAGVRTPEVLVVEDYSLEMEFIEGDKFRDVFEKRKDLWQELGKNIGRLHNMNIVHGDLTTSNVIVKDDELYFIDFGLGYFSERTEDRATDLRLLLQVLNASHHEVSEDSFYSILKGYRQIFEDSSDVINRLDEMEDRTRYS